MLEVVVSDVLLFLYRLPKGSVDTIFADPPYNLGKTYYIVSDRRDDYFEWMADWVQLCYEVLQPGGQLFLMNAPCNLAHQETIALAIGFCCLSRIVWVRRTPAPLRDRFPPSWTGILHCTKPGAKHHFKSGERVPWLFPDRGPHKNTQPISDVWLDIPKLSAGMSNILQKEKQVDEQGRFVLPNQLPIALVKRCLAAATPSRGLVADPFVGVGTTAAACKELNLSFNGCDIDPKFIAVAKKRIADAERT